MLLHVLHPLLLYLTGTQPAPVRLPPLDAEGIAALDAALREPLLRETAVAEAVGFGAPLFTAGMPGLSFDATVAFLERPDGRALAFIHASAGSPAAIVSTISTRFDDGRMLVTSNYGGILRTPPRREVEGIAIPSHFAFGPLWAVHEHRITARAARHAMLPMTRGDDPIEYEHDELCGLYDFWVRRGYYRTRAEGGLKFTLRGAALASWRGLWPWRQWTERRNLRRTAEAVRDMPLLQ